MSKTKQGDKLPVTMELTLTMERIQSQALQAAADKLGMTKFAFMIKALQTGISILLKECEEASDDKQQL